MRVKSIALLTAICLTVSSCGDTRLERSGSGAVTGAAIGGSVGYLSDTGRGAESGLFIGMAVGALIGYLLDRPIFFNSDR